MKLVHAKVGVVGGAVSRMIVSVTSLLVVFPSASLNLMETVFVPSVVTNVCALVAVHADHQLFGLAVLLYATSIPHAHASLPQVMFSVTLVQVTAAAPALIRNDHQLGAVMSMPVVMLESP